MKKIRVLLADDHRMFLAGLQKLLESEFEIVGAVEDGRALVEAAARLDPEVIVADISMPSLNGIDAAQRLRAQGCDAKLIFLTMHGDALFVQGAMRAGAAAYILKRDAPDTLVDAIRRVAQGQAAPAPAPSEDVPLGKLTPRQREVLQLLAEGRSLKEIAWVIQVSVRTVEFHKYELMKRLGVRNGAELTGLAIKHGLVTV